MEREEIGNLALTELAQRRFHLMRENDPEADKAFVALTEIAGRMDAYISKCGAEARQLYEEYSRSMSDTHSIEVEHAYVHGARDCVCLLRFLGML